MTEENKNRVIVCQHPEGSWTPSLLYIHFNTKFSDWEKWVQGELGRINTEFSSVKEATKLQTDTLASKFNAVNEFRGTLTDQAATFITRTEVNAVSRSLDERIGKIELVIAGGAGSKIQRQESTAFLMWAVGLIAGAIAVAATLVVQSVVKK